MVLVGEIKIVFEDRSGARGGIVVKIGRWLFIGGFWEVIGCRLIFGRRGGASKRVFVGRRRIDLWEHFEYFLALIISVIGVPEVGHDVWYYITTTINVNLFGFTLIFIFTLYICYM